MIRPRLLHQRSSRKVIAHPGVSRYPTATFGPSQIVNVANVSGQDIYVLAVAHPQWVIADVVDAPLFLIGVGEIRSAVPGAELPETIRTFSDLGKFLKVAAKLASGTLAMGQRATEAANAIVNAFKSASIKIPDDQYKNAFDQGFLNTVFNATGIAGMLGANTVTLTILSNDNKQVVQFNTAQDYSWITTSRQSIVRSRYGTLWQQDPQAGEEPWPIK